MAVQPVPVHTHCPLITFPKVSSTVSLLSHLSEMVGSAFIELGLDPEFGEVVPSQRPELAQFQCNGAMAAAKGTNRQPREIAEQIVAMVVSKPEILSADVAGPGFINLNLTEPTLVAWAERASSDRRLGFEPSTDPITVVIDYAGPNVAKAMHVGHLRATIIGDSLARLFSFAGHKVIRDPHFGDWGFQMGLLIAAVGEAGISPDEVTLDDLQTIYPEASERARNDDEFADRARTATVKLQQGDLAHRSLWESMRDISETSQRANFSALGVNFDLWYGESHVHDRIAPMVEALTAAGVTEVSDGALVIRVAEEGDNREIPPLILETSAGGFLYSTTDLATVQMRVDELGADLCLYVVDRRQADHFLQVFRAAYIAGIAPRTTSLEHIWFGTMNGPDGRPFKTREGGVVRLSDVIDMVTAAARRRIEEAHFADDYPDEERETIAAQVGVAALKFGDLINNRASDYVFDLDRVCSFEGKTGPYLQYASVRIKSILRKAAAAGIAPGGLIPPAASSETDLILELLRISEVVERSISLRAPNHIAEYSHLVATRFNRFYDECHILSEEDPARQASWLGISAWTLKALELMLGLLGIEVPNRM
jgi:arginyl-tRNA synthetase